MSLIDSWLGNFTSSTSVDVVIPDGAAEGVLAVVGFFTERGDEAPTVTPPDPNWQAGPDADIVATRGGLQTFYKRLTADDVADAAETGTWTFGFSLATNGCQPWSGLWSGRLKTGNPVNITVGLTQDRITQTGVTGTALEHDDVIFGFNEWNGVAETVAGFAKAQEDSGTGAHLFYADNVSAGDITALPSPASSSNTYWYTMLSLKVAGLSADAGSDQSVQAGATVTLHGSADGGVGPYTYAWTQTGGTTVSLSSSTAQNPTFTAPATAGVLTFSLTVTDSTSAASSPDTVNISVSVRPDGTPAAPVNTTVKSWAAAATAAVPLTAESAAGNSLLAILTVRNANVYAAPITDDVGNVWLQAVSTYTVSGLGQPIREFIYYASSANAAENLTVALLDVNGAPVAAAGTIHVLEFAGDIGDPIGSNFGGNVGTDPTTYGVAVASGAGAIIVGALGLGTADRVWAIASGWTSDGHDGTRTDVDQYVGYKIVTGPATTGPSWTRTAGGQTDTTQVTIGFAGGVSLPHANPGVAQAVTVGAGVTLHGSASGGTAPYTYAWTQTKGPSVALSSNTDETPTFTADTAGTYWFQLVVTDDDGTSSAPATAVVVVNPVATGGLLVRSGGEWVPAVLRVRIGGVWV